MAIYRVAIRYGGERPRYEVYDVEAKGLGAAMHSAADRVPEDVAATADLVEIRLQADPEEREYTEG